MSDTTCNGWTNYATWRVNLEICDDYCASMVGEETFESFSDLADALKDYVETIIDDMNPDGLAKDYALAFLDQVNWYEIARHNTELIADEDTDAA